MTIFILLILAALIAEAYIESIYGDEHGTTSNIVLGVIIVSFEIIGFKMFGFKYGWFYYVSMRFLTFDYMYSYFKHGHMFHLGDNFTDKITKQIDKYALLSIRGLLMVVLIIRML